VKPGAGHLLTAAGVLIVLVACVFPLGWIAVSIATFPLRFASIDLPLLGLTLLYNLLAAVIAMAIALPIGVVLGKDRFIRTRLLWVIVPTSLLLPSMAMTYGWTQSLRLVGVVLAPGSAADVMRCVMTLAAWLWPIPALAVGLTLRRADHSIALQALLDGASTRITLRQSLPPLLAGGAVVMLLAGQEFSVFEPTGIRVVATEVRIVFESGLLFEGLTRSQSDRAAAAVMTALPLVVVTSILALAAIVWALREQAQHHAVVIESGNDAALWALVPHRKTVLFAWTLVLLTLMIPIGGLLLSARAPLSLLTAWNEFSPEVLGSLSVACLTGVIAFVTACAAACRRSAALLAVSLVSFLVGGQLIAIAMIRLLNRDFPFLPFDLYDSMIVPVLTYLSRFVWIALLAGGALWAGSWRSLRDMAHLDGAGPGRTFLSVILPLSWPMLVGASLLIVAMSVTEVAATVLIAPLNPPMLVPMLITWVHIQNYDPMIAASLLMICLTTVPGIVGVLLWGLWRQRV